MEQEYWKQPHGLWLERKASASLCQIGMGLYSDFKNCEDMDEKQNHAWHYWSHSPDLEHSVLKELPQHLRNKKNQENESALGIIVLRGKIKALQCWKKKWPEDFHLPQHKNLFILAAWSGQEEILKFILNELQEQTCDFRDEEGMTSLMIAIHRHKIESWVRLLDSGANPNLQDNRGKNALHHIAEYGDLEGFHLLEAAGGDSEQKDENGKTPEEIFERTNHKPLGFEKALQRRWEHRYWVKSFF